MSKLVVMHFGHLEIFVKDPLAAKDFYVNVLGFKLESLTFTDPDGNWFPLIDPNNH